MKAANSFCMGSRRNTFMTGPGMENDESVVKVGLGFGPSNGKSICITT